MLGVAIQMAYALYLFARIFLLPDSSKTSPAPANTTVSPVSIIICARDEANNLRQNLPSVLAQRYMNDAGKLMYEVIVVNDASDDDTETVLQAFSLEYPHLRIVHIPKDAIRNLPGKKFALDKGVAAANNELLLMTDADCRPSSPHWLWYMVQPLYNGKAIVAGVGKYEQTAGLLNAFIRWETMNSVLQYSSYASAGMSYMAVGRNLACTKQAFQIAAQSPEWAKIPSGDDDLLVNAAGNENNVAIVVHPDAFTISPAKQTIGDWIKQKQRHVSTSKYYKPKVILALGIYASAHALIWLLFIPLLFVWNWQEVLLCMLCRTGVYFLLWKATANRMQEKFTFGQYLLFDIGWMVYNFAFSPYIIWKNKKQWK